MGDDREDSVRSWELPSPEGERPEMPVSLRRRNLLSVEELQNEKASPSNCGMRLEYLYEEGGASPYDGIRSVTGLSIWKRPRRRTEEKSPSTRT